MFYFIIKTTFYPIRHPLIIFVVSKINRKNQKALLYNKYIFKKKTIYIQITFLTFAHIYCMCLVSPKTPDE